MKESIRENAIRMAYLVGVANEYLERDYGEEYLKTLDMLRKDDDATKIRMLCQLRTSIMKNFKEVDINLRHKMINLDRQPDYIDPVIIKTLSDLGVDIIKVNYTASQYLKDLCRLIGENIYKCRPLFFAWINWDYIKELFVIPKYDHNNVMIAEYERFHGHRLLYPYGLYIHWNPQEEGNILYNDAKFVEFLYRSHGAEIPDKAEGLYVDKESKNGLLSFIENAQSVSIAVDCENMDPFLLYSAILGLEDLKDKIGKVVLYDDLFTTGAWDVFERMAGVKVEHVEVERVLDHKSLVDMRMVAGIMQDHYTQGYNAFIIASSDSDFKGVISAMPGISFFVLYEEEKCAGAFVNDLEKYAISHCALDDLCTVSSDALKRKAVLETIRAYGNDIFGKTPEEVLKDACLSLKIRVTDQERDTFLKKYVKNIRIATDPEGRFILDFPAE